MPRPLPGQIRRGLRVMPMLTQAEVRVHHDVRERFGTRVFNHVCRLHNKMGHPSSSVLTRVLRDSGASRDVSNFAAEESCEICLSGTHVEKLPPSSQLLERRWTGKTQEGPAARASQVCSEKSELRRRSRWQEVVAGLLVSGWLPRRSRETRIRKCGTSWKW